MNEIGSEFWSKSPPIPQTGNDSNVFLLSGRTALHFVISDIFKSMSVKKALLPSYCCESMILPFTCSGIDVQFYHTDHHKLDYPYNNDADIVLLIDHFGYVVDENVQIARHEKQAGKIVIYDATHKLDGNKELEPWIDYSFCSYRKWFYCNYAKATKHHGKFTYLPQLRSHDLYVALRDKAAEEKRKYISGYSTQKDVFLSKFASAEDILSDDHVSYAGTPIFFNANEIISQRLKNAAYLTKALGTVAQICLWREKIQQNDTPLFVPILVDPRLRNSIRNYLVSKQIYCPIHWPRSVYHSSYNDLYDTELSLICDQRYTTSDMERIVSSIKEFFVSQE